jgi:glycosyltransferase involved in cell wall biosynthesis
MRIAYVINSVEGGGAALPAPAVASVMRAYGALPKAFALTARDGRALAAFDAAGLATSVRAGGERDHLAALIWLDRQLADFRPDVIWTSLTRATLLGQMLGRRRRTPVVSWQHAAYLKPANLALLRAGRYNSALWVADSRCVLRLTAERLRPPPGRLALWPLFAADPAAPQAAAWRLGETLRLGSLGRLHPVKGYDVLIAALARLRAQGFRPPQPFQVVIAGEGAQRPALEAQIREAGLENVALPGFTERPLDFLAGLHLYVQPSRSEGLCIAAHQAMQAGLPVVASEAGEMPFSITSGAMGQIVPADAPEPLAEALAALLSRPAQLAGMGRAARAWALTQFSAEAFAKAGAAVLDRLSVIVASEAGARGWRPLRP